jgi:hypothetical protein
MPSSSLQDPIIHSWLSAVVASTPTECVLYCQLNPPIDMVVLIRTQYRRFEELSPLRELRRAATDQAAPLGRYGLWCWRR